MWVFSNACLKNYLLWLTILVAFLPMESIPNPINVLSCIRMTTECFFQMISRIENSHSISHSLIIGVVNSTIIKSPGIINTTSLQVVTTYSTSITACCSRVDMNSTVDTFFLRHVLNAMPLLSSQENLIVTLLPS